MFEYSIAVDVIEFVKTMLIGQLSLIELYLKIDK